MEVKSSSGIMTSLQTIREERSVSCYSRGNELISAIRSFWRRVAETPRGHWDCVSGGYPINRKIEEWITEILLDFDITVSEWHYWCDELLRADAHSKICAK